MTSINRRIFKDSFVVTLVSLIVQALAFIGTMLVAKNFGANLITDAYYLAFIIPGTFVGIASGIIRLVFIPVFVEELTKNPDNVNNLLRSTISVMLIASSICAVVLAVLFYSNVLSFGQNPEGKALTRILLLELLPLIPLTIITHVFSAIYNSYQRFAFVEFANALRYITVIAAIVFFTGSIGIHALVYGHVVGQFFTLLLSGWIVYRKLGLDIRPLFAFNSTLKRMLRLSLLPFLSYMLAQFNPLISRIIASYLAVGSISVISYAHKLALIPSLVIGTGFMGVLVSHWAKSAAEGDEEQLQKSLNKSVSMLITVLTPIVIGLYILREPLIRLILQRGEFSEEAVLITADVFSILVIAVIPTYLHMIIGRVLYVKLDMVRMFIVTLIQMVLHAVLSYLIAVILGKGAVGIALSTLVSFTILAFLTASIVHRRHIRFSKKMLVGNIIKALTGCLLMLFCIYVFKYFGQSLIEKSGLVFEIISITLIGSSIYMSLLWLVRHPDMAVVLEMVFNLFNNKKISI